jgi:MtN3 and saliva related transmembrane protein
MLQGEPMPSMTTMLGIAAAVASTISFAPQAWKIIRTADTRAISTGMYLMTVSAFALWTAYGARLGQWPLVVSNAICFLLSGFILTMKLLPRGKKRAVSRKVSHAADKAD